MSQKKDQEIIITIKKLEEAVVQRRTAKENNDLKKLKEAELVICQYLEKYIKTELSYKYQKLIDKQDQEEMINEIWIRILERIDGYQSAKGTGTTYVVRDIRHVISDYINWKYYSANQYYGKILRQIAEINSECETQGIPLTPRLVSRKLGVRENKAKEYIQMFARQTIPYDTVDGYIYSLDSSCESAEEKLLRQESEEEVQQILRKYLSEEDAEFFYEYMRDAPENKLKYFREKGTELNIEPDKVRNRINRIQRKLAKGISKEAKEDF